ncbi:MAG: hypothetical protein HN350_02505 [Phycisphaerales bacterium]|nr:hypothetical protein [Phycisphaerales bacterium]
MRLYLTIVMCLLTASVALGRDAEKTVQNADKLAASELHHSVMRLRHSSDKPLGRAARLVGLTEFARRLTPDAPDINSTIAYLSLVRNKPKELAKAINKNLQARPGDYALGLQWLASEMKGLQDADSRTKFLGVLVEDTKRSDELRAAAAVHLADIFIGQGDRKKASDAFDTAVKLDPNLPAALAGKLTLADKTTAADHAKLLINELTINPHSIAQAAKLGEMFDAAGLYKQSARFYDYALDVDQKLRPGQKVSLDFAIQHCNALLNAGQYKRAIEIFGPLTRKYTESITLRMLLIEACNKGGQTERAKLYLGEIVVLFAPRITGGVPDAGAEADLAWLRLIAGIDLPLALEHAKRAQELKPRAPETVKALAAARLLSGKMSLVDLGREGLEKIADKDVFAAAFLAEHYFKINREDDAKKLVLAGLKISRSGQAARRLMAMAKQHKIAIEPIEGSKELKTLAESIPDDLLALGMEPEKSISLKVVAPKRVDSGSGIVVKVELSSSYEQKLSAGAGGFIPATVSLDVTAEGRQGEKFQDVLRIALPFGRYVSSKQKVTASGRIDVGKFGDFLAGHPVDDFQLTVTPRLVAPGAKTPGKYGKLPPGMSAVTPAVIECTSILGKFDQKSSAAWKTAYTRSLSLIMGDLKVAELKTRIRAANQIASLLVLSDGMKAGKLRAPTQLTGMIKRDVLVLMIGEALKNPSDVVRAETLAALGQVKLDGAIIRRLGGIVSDRSALVRFRLVELLGASGLAGQGTILKHFEKDKYDLVSDLAQAMQPAAAK